MIRDNVMLPALKATPKEAQAVVARVEALLERFGIDHLQELSTAEATGGQLQRASICRALAAEPDLVFADEPTATLTGPMTAEVMDALTEVHEDGTTIVIAIHDIACAARADRVLYLKDGRLIDSLTLGRWRRQNRTRREDELLAWIRGLGSWASAR